MTEPASQTPPPKKSSLLKGALRVLYKLVLPLVIVAGGLGFYKYQMDTRPMAQRRPPQRQAQLVTVETALRQNRAAMINAMGTVRPAVEIALTPEVTGIVTYINPMVLPGGLVSAGQVLYQIDSRDYETIVQQRLSDVARAELVLRIEMGNQTVARQEYELLGDLIEEQDIDQLMWIQFPDDHNNEGSSVRIDNPAVWQQGQYRQGRVLRLMGQLEEAGRMAKLLVSVTDPLGLQGETTGPSLLIDSFVRAQIEGHPIPDVVVLPRAFLRDGGNVWVMNDDNQLEIRPVEIVFRGREAVYVSQGLSDGGRVVSSDLAAPVDGMPLRVDSGAQQ